jgi:hypothetical protein
MSHKSRPRSFVSFLLLAALCSIVLPLRASSQSVQTITLVSGNGPIGSLDPVTEFSINGTTWAPATIVPACCQLGQSLVNYDVIPGTQLIARDSTGQTPVTPTTLYRVFFTLPQIFSFSILKVTMHADNVGSVSLNGNAVGSQPGNPVPVSSNFRDPPSFFFDANPAHFVPGQNEIRFSVLNFGGPSTLDYKADISFLPGIVPAGINPCSNPTLIGTPGNDAIIATNGPQIIDGLGGDDAIVTGDFDDIVCGGPGNDVIATGKGKDKIYGGTGNDILDGGDDNDWIFGDAGDDHLGGGAGIDLCIGGGGNDTFQGCP